MKDRLKFELRFFKTNLRAKVTDAKRKIHLFQEKEDVVHIVFR